MRAAQAGVQRLLGFPTVEAHVEGAGSRVLRSQADKQLCSVQAIAPCDEGTKLVAADSVSPCCVMDSRAAPLSASSSSAAVRSETWTGQRISSVNRTPSVVPAASWCTNCSCTERPCPMIREVRTTAASGCTTRTPVSAAALAAPYGVMGSGRQFSS